MSSWVTPQIAGDGVNVGAEPVSKLVQCGVDVIVEQPPARDH